MWKRSEIMYFTFISIFCSVLFAVIAVSTTNSNKSKCKETLIIDTDAGGDDAVAILLLLEIQKHMKQCLYEVVAITCTYGNTDEKQVQTNVRKTLTIAGRPDIPVYAGATRSMLREFNHADSFFGTDAFGDFKFEDKILSEVDQSMHASLAMIELSKTHEGVLNILTLGPTTNVALAGALDRGFFDRVKQFHVVGSSVAGFGNISPGVEYNFAADPEGNFILLNSTISSKLTIFPWETGLNSGYTNEWRKNALKGHDSKIVKFLNNIEALALNKTYHPVDVFAAAATLMGDKFIKKSLETNMEAVVDGRGRGSVLVDYVGGIKPLNAKIIQSIDIELYKRMFMCAFTNECNGFE